jgi:septum formation protein
MGIAFACEPADLDETILPGESAGTAVRRLALGKARAVAARSEADAVVLGADTVVVLDGRILGKPADRAHGVDMLRALSGRRHTVLTGVAVVRADTSEDICVGCEVEFAELSEVDIERYWRTGESADKAGAYGIQGIGGRFVRRIDGSYGAVVGLPMYEVAMLLQRFGVDIWQGSSG